MFGLKIREYKIGLFVFAGIITCLLVVLIVSQVIGVINKIKQSRYIGADIAYKNTISVTGEGKVYTKPDIAIVSLSVVTQGNNIKSVQDENTEKMNDVADFLKDFGVEEKDIKTIVYRIYPRYNYENRKIPEIIGYEITQTLEIKIKQMDKIGEILDNAVDVGINQVSSLRFGNEDDEELKAEARKLAIEDAKEKAKELALDLGVKLIKITGFNEGTVYDYAIYRELGIGGGGVPEIQTGENEISVNITLIYEID